MASLESLLTAAQLAKSLRNLISVERLNELAESETIPHIRFEGARLFQAGMAKKWLRENLVTEVAGCPIGSKMFTVNVMLKHSPGEYVPPVSLRGMSRHLIPLDVAGAENKPFPGVYFLCHEGVVVYVGQSVAVLSRVPQHCGVKTFSSAFYVPVPERDLNFVEMSFIKRLKPKYNVVGKNDARVLAKGSSASAELIASAEAVPMSCE